MKTVIMAGDLLDNTAECGVVRDVIDLFTVNKNTAIVF